jgi:hypothetical protein
MVAGSHALWEMAALRLAGVNLETLTVPAWLVWAEERGGVRPPRHILSAVQARCAFFWFFSRVARQFPAMVKEAVPGWVMVLRDWRESGGLHEPDPPVQRWRLYRAFDGGDGGGGASWLQRWTRLALVRGRTG